MKHLWVFRVFMVILTTSLFGNEVVAFAGTDWEESATNKASLRLDETMKAITGEVLRMGEDMVVIQDVTGTETPLRIDRFTAMIGDIKHGDMVEAHISRDGWILSVRRIFQIDVVALFRS